MFIIKKFLFCSGMHELSNQTKITEITNYIKKKRKKSVTILLLLLPNVCNHQVIFFFCSLISLQMHSHTIENKNGNGFNDAFCFSQGLPIFPKGAKIKSLGGYSIGIAQLRGPPIFIRSRRRVESGCQLRSTYIPSTSKTCSIF